MGASNRAEAGVRCDPNRWRPTLLRQGQHRTRLDLHQRLPQVGSQIVGVLNPKRQTHQVACRRILTIIPLRCS